LINYPELSHMIRMTTASHRVVLATTRLTCYATAKSSVHQDSIRSGTNCFALDRIGNTGRLTILSNFVPNIMARTDRSNWTEQNWLYWHGLFFDELTSGQAVMHYSRHRLTASSTYATALTYASTKDQ